MSEGVLYFSEGLLYLMGAVQISGRHRNDDGLWVREYVPQHDQYFRLRI